MSRTAWVNADVVTLDDAQPGATALVSDGERLVYVGDDAGARARAQGGTVVDLGGRSVVPGFNDNHLHLVIHGAHSYVPDLTGLNEAQCVAAVRAFADAHPEETILQAFNWDSPTCPNPTKELLDAVVPDKAVVLAQFGGHGLWVNSVVLKAMGIDRHAGPPGGRVARDAQGDPTGVLLEMGDHPYVTKVFFAMFFDRKKREPRILKALDVYRKAGITSVQDNSWFVPVPQTLAKLRRQGQLTVRVSCWAFGRVPSSIPLMRWGGYDADWVRRGPDKYFLDGTFTTRTAWMTETYPGRPGEYGMGFDPRWLETILERLVRARRQGAFHSIGDKSTATFLDVWQKVLARHPEARDLRMRLEHVQAVRPEDVARLRELGVSVAAQPPALATPEKDAEILGRERASACYPHRSLLDAGVALSYGSDIPGESFCEPLRALHLVCNRTGPQRMSPLDALRAYTQGSARVEFEEHRKGTLKAGYFADFAVLSGNPLAVDPTDLESLTVERTVVGGRTVWDASKPS